MADGPSTAAPDVTLGTLWVVATPIGNLEDMTLRGIRILGEVDVVACEDTRLTRRLLQRHHIAARRLVSYHEHNESTRSVELCALLATGASVALVSDAGMPLVCDPGGRLVEAAIALGAIVSPIPGASAALAALAVSGLVSDGFTFRGFLPSKGRVRQQMIEEVMTSTLPVVLYESPHRIVRTVAELARHAPDRRASLHRELTKLHEESLRGRLDELAIQVTERAPRGEYTVVVAGKAELQQKGDLAAAVRLARKRIGEGQSLTDAAREVAAAEQVPRRALYKRLLESDKNPDEEE